MRLGRRRVVDTELGISIPPHRCRVCRMRTDRAVVAPDPGDWVVCLRCGWITSFDGELERVEISFAEWMVALRDPFVRRVVEDRLGPRMLGVEEFRQRSAELLERMSRSDEGALMRAVREWWERCNA